SHSQHEGMKILLLLELLFLCHGGLGQHPNRRKVTLYGTDDPLVILDNASFDTSVVGSSTAWVVQFYNSWCGHCINYAPHWKLFAEQVKGWWHTVKVAVLDCSTEDNTKLCRDYEINGTPTIRIFPPNTTQGFLGYTTRARDVPEVVIAVLDFLTTQQAAGNGSATWPSLQTYTESVSNIWEHLEISKVDKVAIVVEPNTSYIGRAAVLDLAVYRPEVSILTMLGEEEHPSLMLMEHGSNSDKSGNDFQTTNINPGNMTSRDELVGIIKENFNLMDEISKTTISPLATTEEGGSALDLEPNFDFSHFPKDQVYMVDIENAIAYALRNEMAQQSQYNTTEQAALLDFLRVLVHHLPLRSSVSNFLNKLHNFIQQQNATIGGSEMEEAFALLSNGESSELPSVRSWVGCRGSFPRYRGYPCGLWTTFHAITVNLTHQEEVEHILPAIHGFVKYFFGCRECSQHFQAMYASDGGTEVKTADDVVLWLWRAHNKVNLRIKGAASEDPEHPKSLFPNKNLCPLCWASGSSGHYVDTQVLSYLRSIYGKDRITLVGTQELESSGLPESREHTSEHTLDGHRHGFL
ncbi:unnamed protein product, partial [Meganyctiphanes norvegica]